jgi:hypothetical protein
VFAAPAPGAAPPVPLARSVLEILRAAVAGLAPEELLPLRMTGMCVQPGAPDAPRWALDAQPPLQSPRSPARRPITFLNLRAAGIDVIWIGFDGAERRYTRAADNVESRVRVRGARSGRAQRARAQARPGHPTLLG